VGNSPNRVIISIKESSDIKERAEAVLENIDAAGIDFR
jgi:hypothetical protein